MLTVATTNKLQGPLIMNIGIESLLRFQDV
jgi:hypothetical protein